MRKQIFQAICARLSERVPEIMFIDLWNNNVAVLSGGAVWPMPAVFVEFETIEWRQQNNGARRGNVAVRLHLVTRAVNTHGHNDVRASEALAFFDLIDRINTAMQGLRGDNFSGFQLTTSATNHDHAELLESVERYVTSAQDATAVPEAARVDGLTAVLQNA
jgi:hypothetical protein